MKFVFRTDASIEIGTGHVIRCLTLADALTAKGATCEFICRDHPGNLIEQIWGKGYSVHRLPVRSDSDKDLKHSLWLGATQLQDAQACAPILAELKPDWLVSDHYALDFRLEDVLANLCRQVMVIDDLADRPHRCKILLDQTMGRDLNEYRLLVPRDCTLLCGSKFAILRPEFSRLRPISLQRRLKPQLKQILVSMGGVDKDNITSDVLAALSVSDLPSDCKIKIVLGITAPWLNFVRKITQTMRQPTEVLIDVKNMAQLMSESDLSIGSAGGSSWERCCLGLPSIIVVSADNQVEISNNLEKLNAAKIIRSKSDVISQLPPLLSKFSEVLSDLTLMSLAASSIVSGEGTDHIVSQLEI
jgi:UDP-2,4-diacetamido-2,4,6-trideoxy-beta-L-altropyranose hydrolase